MIKIVRIFEQCNATRALGETDALDEVHIAAVHVLLDCPVDAIRLSAVCVVDEQHVPGSSGAQFYNFTRHRELFILFLVVEG